MKNEICKHRFVSFGYFRGIHYCHPSGLNVRIREVDMTIQCLNCKILKAEEK